MPNLVDSTGIHTKTIADVVADLTAAYQSIYGADINVDSNSPDGQKIHIFAQMIVDDLDLMTQVYSSFDPDQAIGTTLDARCAFNGVKRLGGTYTTVQISIVTDRAVALQGLDGDINNPDGVGYTVSDNAGNQFILANSYSIPSAGTTVLTFRAKSLGAVLTTVNTITVPISVVIGVLSVNNPSSSLTTGLDQEQDSALKIRRRKSVSISSLGYLDALLAALLNVPGVTSAAVYENVGGSTDADSIPGHSIWAIVQGGADAAIAAAIYAKRSGGVGMKGATTYSITRPNGSPFVIAFDRTATERLYIKLTLDTILDNIVDIGTTTSGSAIVTAIGSTTKMRAGMLIRGTGIPLGTTVLSVDSSTQIHLSANATASNTGTAITVVPLIVADVKTGIASALVPTIYQTLDINHLVTLLQAFSPKALATFPSGNGFSADNSTFTKSLTPTAKNVRFTIATADITIV